ncbi:MAG: prepilin-type N-terminal cleavage/methylation domain-containing protein [Candidatus Omnitrophica bacterium]|nr:prepilin-type N-terminal cleavage/methylation domain-containing protein [Candidatus Omnitrophota bacterium]
MQPGLPVKKRVIQLKIPEKTAFTMIELIITVIIIAILAAIVVPNYTKAKEKAMGKEALANLKLIAAADRVYRVEQGAYVNCNCTTTLGCVNSSSGCNYLLRLDISPENWAYAVRVYGSGTSAYIRATASRQGSGAYRDCVYTVNENGDLISAVSCP